MALDKKDISVLVEGQLPEYVTSEHPKFKKFIEKYYEFMESHELYFDGVTFDEFKIVPEDTLVADEGVEYFAMEFGIWNCIEQKSWVTGGGPNFSGAAGGWQVPSMGGSMSKILDFAASW